ncbi:hypothetical protein GMMP15_90031 [Candidatus Magnetomoraceae bacterium gMMP-15]
MELKFITTKKYAGREIKVGKITDPFSGTSAHSWEDNQTCEAKRDGYSNIFKDKDTDVIFKNNGDEILNIALLKHEDINNLGNIMFKIDGKKKQYFLKILGDTQENEREILAWKSLGYDLNTGKRQGEWIPGLPPFVYVLERLNTILTPYYPGLLKAVTGGGYEFPLVLNMIININETLHKMHKAGLLYMDLHPDNIVFRKKAPILFFLTDMGGVRPFCSSCNDEWEKLNKKSNGKLCEKRWTRAEVMPPESLFPMKKGCPFEIDASYDFYTFARTAMILAGLSQPSNQSVERFEQVMEDSLKDYPEDFILENPLNPDREEIKIFYNLMKAPLFEKKDIDTDKVDQLFKGFFMKRAEFTGKYLGNDTACEKWKEILLDRLKLYKTALKIQDKDIFIKKLQNQFQNSQDKNGIKKDIEVLNSVPQNIIQKKFKEADQALNILSESRLVKVSETACYSYSFHRKVLRLLNDNEVNAPIRQSFMNQLPEKKTIKELRSNRTMQLDTLSRYF